MRFMFYISLFVAKILYAFLRITKLSSGTAIIGLITLKICPDFLLYVNKYITKSKINITGTNGKTTTSGILTHIIKNSDKTIINNSVGANMLNGIVNTLALQTCPLKPVEFSVLETDEAFVSKVYEKMDADYLLVTNLFEDQTDRFETPIYTKSLIQKGIDKKTDIQLILNADEPISASLKSKNKTPIYFGIQNILNEDGQLIESSGKKFNCPICNAEMNYTKNFYSQIGHYTCDCGYTRPQPKYSADVKVLKNSLEIILDNEIYEIPLMGIYNAYNALGAIALAKELGIKNITESLKTFKVAFGRNEKRNLNGHETLIQLIKNPTGTNEVLKGINLDSHILIAINNNIADGTDVSWINQVEFEKLSSAKNEVIVTGLCAEEMTKRLEKAGVKKIKTLYKIDDAVKYIGNSAENNITILTTYTALLKIDKIKEIKKCF